MDERQRMWWEAATTATTGLLAALTRETYPDIPIPDRVSLLVVRVAGQYADDLLAEYDRRFPTPHPAPAAATVEGEDGVRYYSRFIPGGENQVGFKVERGQAWFRGGTGVWTESLTRTPDELEVDVSEGKRRRLTPTEAAASDCVASDTALAAMREALERTRTYLVGKAHLLVDDEDPDYDDIMWAIGAALRRAQPDAADAGEARK